MKNILQALCLLLTLLALAQLGGCTTAKSYWTGFHGPAYLPARPAPRPGPVHPIAKP